VRGAVSPQPGVDLATSHLPPVAGVKPVAEATPGILERAWEHRDGVLARLMERFGRLSFTRPPEDQLFMNRPGFRRQALDWVLPAEREATPILCIGGLASTGYHLKNVGMRLRLAGDAVTGGGRLEVASLPGHDGSWDGFLRYDFESWVAAVRERALRVREVTGRLPLIVGHSTGAAAAAVAIHRHQIESGDVLCAGAILSAPPLGLRHPLHALALANAHYEHRRRPHAPVWQELSAAIPVPRGVLSEAGEKRNPFARWVPVKLLVELWRLMPEASAAVAELAVPFLVLQSRRDSLVAHRVVRGAVRMNGGFGDYEEFVRGRHSAMFGETGRDFRARILAWLNRSEPRLAAIERTAHRAALARCCQARFGAALPSPHQSGGVEPWR